VPRRVEVADSFGNITLELPPGSTAISVPQAPSAADVITATNNSEDITIAAR